jgi:hypothetical protein
MAARQWATGRQRAHFPGIDGKPWTREQYQNWRKRL